MGMCTARQDQRATTRRATALCPGNAGVPTEEAGRKRSKGKPVKIQARSIEFSQATLP